MSLPAQQQQQQQQPQQHYRYSRSYVHSMWCWLAGARGIWHMAPKIQIDLAVY
eukprot:COSAG01_NODE_8658_length_2705_cov_19.586723_6_plen_53_part_00